MQLTLIFDLMLRKSQGKFFFFKVRELSGNFKQCRGILEFKQK